MKKIFIITMIIVLVVANITLAQDKTSTKVHELGLTFSSLNSFGLNYKTGTEKKLLRLSALFLTASTSWGKGNDPATGAGFSVSIGCERRIRNRQEPRSKIGLRFRHWI